MELWPWQSDAAKSCDPERRRRINSPTSLFWYFHGNPLYTEQMGCPLKSRAAGRSVDRALGGPTKDTQNTVKKKTFLDRSLENHHPEPDNKVKQVVGNGGLQPLLLHFHSTSLLSIKTPRMLKCSDKDKQKVIQYSHTFHCKHVLLVKTCWPLLCSVSLEPLLLSVTG